MKKTFAVVLVILMAINSVFATSANAARPSVAVVLSGGETRGFGHIVLLETLEKMGIPIDAVYGSSSGALIGGLYCAGYSPEEIREIIESNDLLSTMLSLNSSPYIAPGTPMNVNTYNIFSIDITDNGVLNVNGILKNNKIVDQLNDLLSGIPSDMNFDDLPVRFRCTASNAVTGDLEVCSQGSIVQAIASSMAIPIVFTPVYDDGNLYSDGGFSNNIPADIAKKDGYDIVITEDLNYRMKPNRESFKSISSYLSAMMRLIVDNKVANFEKYSDVVLAPDFGQSALFSVSFDEACRIVQEEVDRKMPQLEAVAALFEDDKYVKDPRRTGIYDVLYAEDSGKYEFHLTNWTEKLPSYSIVTFGLNEFDSFSFDFESKEIIENPRIQFTGFRLYMTDLGTSGFGLDVRTEWKEQVNLFVSVPYRVKGDFYLVPQFNLSANNSGAGLGIRYTDREHFDASVNGLHRSKDGFILNSNAILSDNLNAGKSVPERFIVEYSAYAKPFEHLNFGYDVSANAVLRLFEAHSFKLWVDYAGRQSDNLNLNKIETGGALMPEFNIAEVDNFHSAGISLRYTLFNSVADVYGELRGRVILAGTTPVLCSGLAVGINTPIGNMRIGLALNSTDQINFFFDFR